MLFRSAEEEEGRSASNKHGDFFLAALVARSTQAVGATGGPVASPAARHEQREAIQSYYRTAIAGGNNGNSHYFPFPRPSSSPDNNNIDVVEEPDLAVPVGDEYLYLAQ